MIQKNKNNKISKSSAENKKLIKQADSANIESTKAIVLGKLEKNCYNNSEIIDQKNLRNRCL